MWLVGCKRLDIYLASHGILIDDNGHITARRVDGFGSALVEMKAWLEVQSDRYSIYIWLSGNLCRPFVLPIMAGALDSAERDAVVNAVAIEATGLGGANQAACRLEVSGNLGAQVQVQTLNDISKMLLPFVAKSIQPLWANIINSSIPQQTNLRGVAVYDGDSLVLVCADDDGYSKASTISSVGSRASAESAWARALMEFDAEVSKYAFVEINLEDQLNLQTKKSEKRKNQPFSNCIEVTF